MCPFEKVCFETGLEGGERVNIVNVLREGSVGGTERLKTLDLMVDKLADGVVSWMAEVDLRVRVWVCRCEVVQKDAKELSYEGPER